MERARNDQIHRFAQTLGLDEAQLRRIVEIGATESNINEFGRFDSLKSSVNVNLTKSFLDGRDGATLTDFQVNIKIDKLLRDFILHGRFEA